MRWTASQNAGIYLMATCLKVQAFAAFPTTASSTKTAYTAMTIDAVGDPTTCAYLMVSGSELTDLNAVASTRITSIADAEVIAGSFFLLLAIAFGIRMIGRSMHVDHVSDEKF